jgi:hypothetical protein
MYVIEAWSREDRSLRPLEDLQREKIMKHWIVLSNLIDLDSGLIGELCAKGCISQNQRQAVEQQPTMQKVDKLLGIFLRKSLAAFDTFIECLRLTGQGHVAELLIGTAGEIIASFRN